MQIDVIYYNARQELEREIRRKINKETLLNLSFEYHNCSNVYPFVDIRLSEKLNIPKYLVEYFPRQGK